MIRSISALTATKLSERISQCDRLIFDTAKDLVYIYSKARIIGTPNLSQSHLYRLDILVNTSASYPIETY